MHALGHSTHWSSLGKDTQTHTCWAPPILLHLLLAHLELALHLALLLAHELDLHQHKGSLTKQHWLRLVAPLWEATTNASPALPGPSSVDLD